MSDENVRPLPASVAAHERAARCCVLTIGDARSAAGGAAGRLLREAGHEVVDRQIVPDDPAEVAAVLDRWLPAPHVDCVVTTGGTGVALRDCTVEVVAERLYRELPGFGETFRRLSFDEIGPPALLGRAVGGVTSTPNPAALFALPGGSAAVELAVGRLIAPLLSHLVAELRKPA